MMQNSEEAMWRGEVTNELRHIGERVRDAQRQLVELRDYIAREFADHREYHARNEQRWGFARWCQMHPFRLAALVAAAGAALWLRQHTATIAQLGTLLSSILR